MRLHKPIDEQASIAAKQSRAVTSIDLKIIGSGGKTLPWDGTSAGDLMVRGHWILNRYHGVTQSPLEEWWIADHGSTAGVP